MGGLPVWNSIVPIVVGFLLTTVIGGSFATRLQDRTWHHQNDVRLREEDQDKASDVCHSLAGLVDKRWYRMKRLLWAIVDSSEGRLADQALDARLADYDQVLFEWNDLLNGRLAIVGAYFGRDLRNFPDKVVYPAFAEAGSQLETLYR
jgi:hypothetical protein